MTPNNSLFNRTLVFIAQRHIDTLSLFTHKGEALLVFIFSFE